MRCALRACESLSFSTQPGLVPRGSLQHSRDSSIYPLISLCLLSSQASPPHHIRESQHGLWQIDEAGADGRRRSWRWSRSRRGHTTERQCRDGLHLQSGTTQGKRAEVARRKSSNALAFSHHAIATFFGSPSFLRIAISLPPADAQARKGRCTHGGHGSNVGRICG